MDPVSTGVGLAASLATLIEIGFKSYTALSRLTRQMKIAPESILELCRKVKRLEELLSAVHTFVIRMRDDELPPNLRTWWNSNMNDIMAELKALESLADRLNVLHTQAASNGSKFSARLKTVLSSDEIAKYETSIENNIKELDRIRGYLDSWKLREAQTTLHTIDTRTQSISTSIDDVQPALVREIRRNFESFEPIINARFDNISQAVETVRNHVLATHVSLRRVQPSSKGESSACHRGSCRTQVSATQRRERLPRWNVQIFDLPIGTLVVENSKGGHIDTSEDARMNCVAFRFKPKLWMIDGIFSVEHFFSIAANSSPTWQSVQRRVPSLFSEELLNSLEKADLLQLGSILVSSFCSFKYLDLFSTNYLKRRRDFGGSLSFAASRDRVTDFCFGFKSLSESSSFADTADLRYSNRQDQPSKAMLVCNSGTWEAWPMQNFTESFLGGPHEWPTMLVSPDDRGYRLFMQHVCPCLESVGFEELDTIDRWWFSALNHEDSRFGAAIQSHLYHLDESGDHFPATLRRVTGKDYLDYNVTVDEVLAASHTKRQNFLRMVYACCTAKCLRPFLDAGHDPNTVANNDPDDPISLYQVAVQARNFPVIQELKAKGLQFLVQDTMTPVYPSMPGKEIDFEKEQELLNAILFQPQKQNESACSLVYCYCRVHHADDSKYGRNNILYQSDLMDFSAKELYKRGLGSYCHPPYHRRLFLGPELLVATITTGEELVAVPRLLYLGASLDYAGPSFLPYNDQRTALAWSIDLGRADVVLLMAIAANNFEDYDASLRAGLHRAKMHLNVKHPRHFFVPIPDSPGFPDPVSRWEERQLRKSSGVGIRGNAFQTEEVSRIQDILTYTILEMVVAGGSIGRTTLAAMAEHTERLHDVFWYDLERSPEEALRILTGLAELAGVEKPQLETPEPAEQARITNFKQNLTRLVENVRDYRLSILQTSWSRAAMAAVGLTLCLRAMLEHILYEFVAWVWIQRAAFKRLWPFMLLSTVVLFAAWLM